MCACMHMFMWGICTCLCATVFVYVPLCVFMCCCVFVSLCVCVFMCHCVCFMYYYVYVCLCAVLFMFMCHYVCAYVLLLCVCMGYSTAQRQCRTHSQFFISKLLSLIKSQAFSAQRVVNTRLETQQYVSDWIIIEMFALLYTFLPMNTQGTYNCCTTFLNKFIT